jgi:hypothetical protein
VEACHAGKDNRHHAFIEVKASEYGLGASRIRTRHPRLRRLVSITHRRIKNNRLANAMAAADRSRALSLGGWAPRSNG